MYSVTVTVNCLVVYFTICILVYFSMCHWYRIISNHKSIVGWLCDREVDIHDELISLILSMKEVRWLFWLITVHSSYFSAAHSFDQFTVKPLLSQSINLPWNNSMSVINKCVLCWLAVSPVMFNFQDIDWSVNSVTKQIGEVIVLLSLRPHTTTFIFRKGLQPYLLSYNSYNPLLNHTAPTTRVRRHLRKPLLMWLSPHVT